MAKKPIAVVDLFSGPGGLGEGFSACRDASGERRYKIDISVEKEASAHRTLQLRAFLRQFPVFPPEYYAWLNGIISEPCWPILYPYEWKAAEHEALCLELGKPETTRALSNRIRKLNAEHGGKTVLIGGPPCQAYSLVGRARNAGKADYLPEFDDRHFLYEEYVKVLSALSPAAFVMENVKGMLSSAVKGDAIFARVLADLRSAAGANSYQLFAVSPTSGCPMNPTPSDFVVRAEDHGVPQARHRVIILGLRRDVASNLSPDTLPRLSRRKSLVTLSAVLGAMPKMRSGLSRADDMQRWILSVREAVRTVGASPSHFTAAERKQFAKVLHEVRENVDSIAAQGRSGLGGTNLSEECPPDLRKWLVDPLLTRLPQNETRGHMPSDLARYLFAAAYGKVFHQSPKASDFPESLAPHHRNWDSGKFTDRFRVQLDHRPSTTITSHISKDGHYVIHPDPVQCRSLTVREAARLQTFPDNYAFLGNRTEQYVQVGNAVPPFLALQIAEALFPALNTLESRTEGRHVKAGR